MDNSELTNSFSTKDGADRLLLMCKDIPVYDITAEKVIDSERAPGLLTRNQMFSDWMKLRRSSNTNGSARYIKNFIYRDKTRAEADILNRSLSLSDCYWIKREDETVLFEDVSPYFSNYWENTDMNLQNTAKPTLHVNGYKDKRWISPTEMYKEGCLIEVVCAELCEALGLDSCKVTLSKDGSGVIVTNFTNTDVMLESCDMSGIITEDNITTTKILQVFDLDGFKMLLLDAIIGNGDRHTGNFGFLRDANTGEYFKTAPLYDFDHALDSTNDNDVLIEEIVNLATTNEDYKKTALKILSAKRALTIHSIFEQRANRIFEKINTT